MSKYRSQIQNQFLSLARKKHTKVEIILETGTVLRGKLKAYDQFSISLSFKDKVEVIYKSAIIYIAIMPSRPRFDSRYDRDNDRGYDRRPPRKEYEAPAQKIEEPKPYPDMYEDTDDEMDPPPPKKPTKNI